MRNAVVVVADEYLFPAAMFLCEQLHRLGPPLGTDIILVSDSIADIEIARKAGSATHFLPIGADVTDRPFSVNRHLTKATYYRIFVPELLSGNYQRILYLDVDIYVQDAKVFHLFDLNMGANAVAAVRDTIVAHTRQPDSAKEVRQTLVGGAAGNYLNAGVQLIDIKAFLHQHLIERILTVIDREPKLTFLDQSALNIALKGDWLELSPSFNLQGSAWHSFVREICEPVLVHFIGGTKPWHGPRFVEDHPVRSELERYIASSPWKGYLSRFWTFQDAWNARSGPPHKRERFTNNPIEIGRILHYLHNTAFADVEQGLTTLNLEEPRRAQPPR